MGNATTLDVATRTRDGVRTEPVREDTMFVLMWAAHEPARVGEILGVPDGLAAPCVFGRGEASDNDRYERALLVRQRPGANERTESLENPFLSRQQLKLTREEDGVRLENLGKRPLLVDGREITTVVARPGELVEIKNLMLFLCVRRAVQLPASSYPPVDGSARFGEADPHGIVGEGPLAWELRDQIAFLAGRNAHVLITGDSGTGKELVAQAIHALSSRRGKRMIARNAATFPTGLIDAELFGNVANYPNAGMPERLGLIGESDGSTMFLDEIGELPAELQTHLLRVLDDGGEYQRLGEARPRRADIRLVAATNRPADHLKHDLAARLALRISVAGLNERREDIPLLVRHVLRRIASRDLQLGARFFEGWNGRSGEPRVSLDLMRALVIHTYRTHVRELDGFLWSALAASKGKHVEVSPVLRARLAGAVRAIDPSAITAEDVRAALESCGGVRERAWRELGLPSRHALHRLMKKHGIEDAATEED